MGHRGVVDFVDWKAAAGICAEEAGSREDTEQGDLVALLQGSFFLSNQSILHCYKFRD